MYNRFLWYNILLARENSSQSNDKGFTHMDLRAQNVKRVYEACLLQDHEDGAEFVTAECYATAHFHGARLRDSRQDIADMLAELPDRFRTYEGAEFFAASENRAGWRWVGTDEVAHWEIEMLVLLGRAIGAVEYIIPREDWTDFPDFRLIP